VWERPFNTLTFVPKDGCVVNVQQLQEVVATLRPSDFIKKQLDTNPFVVLSQPASSIHKNGLFLLANGIIANGKKMEEMTLKYFGQDLVAEITRACIDRNYEEVVGEYGTNNNGDHQQTKWHFGEDGSSGMDINSTTITDSRTSSIKNMMNSNEKVVNDENPFLCDISSISSSSVNNRKTQHEEEGINYLILFIVFYLYIFLCSIMCVH
jgi:hypothetical protein